MLLFQKQSPAIRPGCGGAVMDECRDWKSGLIATTSPAGRALVTTKDVEQLPGIRYSTFWLVLDTQGFG